MIDPSSRGSIPTWRFISPETFELSLRRLMQPSAEAKLKEALNLVIQQIEASKHGPKAELRAQYYADEKLRKKRVKLERRLKKLGELKQMAVVPLVFGLFFGLIVWLVIFAVTSAGAVATGTTIQQAIASNQRPADAVKEALEQDKAGIEEHKNTGLTIQELAEDTHAGQILGLPPQDEAGNFLKVPEHDYADPEFLIEIVDWLPDFASCDVAFSKVNFDGTLAGCEAAAEMNLVKVDDPSVTMKCLWLQLGNENGKNSAASISQQTEFGNQARFFSDLPFESTVVKYRVQDPTNGWDETMMLFCQVFGTQDDLIAKTMVSNLMQMGVRTDAGFYSAGGILTWLESDGSYAPLRVWEGHGPKD